MSAAFDLVIEGAERAAAHANAVHPSPRWVEHAYAAACVFTDLSKWAGAPGADFLAEDIRAFAEANGVPRAPDERAWGAVILRLSRDGVIRKTGEYRPMKNPASHCNPKAVWTAA